MNCSEKNIQKSFSLNCIKVGLIFRNNKENLLFNVIFHEVLQIIAILVYKKVIEIDIEVGVDKYNPKKEELIKIPHIYPNSIEDLLKKEITNSLFMLWKICLLIGIEGHTEKTADNQIKLANYLIRYSRNKRGNELKLIQTGILILKGINYKNIKLPNDSEAINDLGNAIEIYTDKWIDIIKEDIEIVLDLMKQSNPPVYHIIYKYIKSQSKNLKKCSIKNERNILFADQMFLRMISETKKIFNNMLSIGNYICNNTYL